MSHKMFTAFISSPGTLTEERQEILDVLLNFDVFPVAMEHFVVRSTEGFHDIEQLIDDSDIFILLLGKTYGSREFSSDDNGLSWTEKEYIYANKHNSNIIVFQLSELSDLIRKVDEGADDEELETIVPGQSAKDTRSQVDFARKLSSHMVCEVSDKTKLRTNLAVFVEGVKRNNKASGWIRGVSSSGFSSLDFKKTYYQVHLSESDPAYIRVGTAKFSANITSPMQVHVDGINYKPTYDPATDSLSEAVRNRTEWNGDYSYENGALLGIYEARRKMRGTFSEKKLSAGSRRGIHEFRLSKNKAYVLYGTFQDAVDLTYIDIACKSGEIYFFDSEENRLDFLKKEYSDTLETITEEK